MHFRVLGPLHLTHSGGQTAVSAPRLQQLIALLLMARGKTLPLGALCRELWPAGSPATADTTIRTYVHELRKLLPGGPGQLATEGTGYRLSVPWHTIDALCFEDLVSTARTELRVPGRSSEPAVLEKAVTLLREALALWRGPAFAGVPTGPQLDLHLADLEGQWLRATQLRVHLDLLLGLHRELIGELKGLVGAYPLEDWFTAQLMVALHRSGRRGEALRAYQAHQAVIRAELGTVPAPRLTRLRDRVLSAQCTAPVATLLC